MSGNVTFTIQIYWLFYDLLYLKQKSDQTDVYYELIV